MLLGIAVKGNMAKIKFQSVPGVTGSETTNPMTIRLDAAPAVLSKLKKMLTIRNKSADRQVMKAKKGLEFWYKLDKTEKVLKKIADLEDIIKENEPEILQEYFTDHGIWLEVPAGFWWLPEKWNGAIAPAYLNREAEPVLMPWLRDYQKEMVTTMLTYTRATGVLPTGAGKSAVITSLCKSLVACGKRVCVVVPTTELVDQTAMDIEKEIPDTASLGGKNKHPKLGVAVIVTTAASAKKCVDIYDAIIIDESQYSAASTWVELLTAAEKATHVYNLTATPFRADGMDLAIHAFGGPTVFSRDAR